MSNAALKLDTNGQHTYHASYQPRSPLNSAYHKLVADNYEELESNWESYYQHIYGYWRPHVLDVIYRYLDCGDPHLGFARIKCTDCNTEYLLPFSCKCRSFCPNSYSSAAISAADFPSLLDVEVCEGLQLNMFSCRSYEWWEACKNRSTQEDCRQECEEYQHPYEDEHSQEVFYED